MYFNLKYNLNIFGKKYDEKEKRKKGEKGEKGEKGKKGGKDEKVNKGKNFKKILYLRGGGEEYNFCENICPCIKVYTTIAAVLHIGNICFEEDPDDNRGGCRNFTAKIIH